MKAKTKTKLIVVLNAILCVVFAFMVGWTYCANSITKNESNKYSTKAYAVNNNYKFLNSTTENEVVFGQGSHSVKFALDYSLYYNFDVRINYSLKWSNDASTENVILNFAGRDRFIVDDSYIYLTTYIPAGSGTLNIINSVSFVDPEDENYYGETLQIIVNDIQVVKAVYVDYDASNENKSTHRLYANTVAGNAWAKLRSGTIQNSTSADIIVYNARYNTDVGIVHPGIQTAYKDATKLLGNRFYAGAGMYVMTGSKSVTLTLKSVGSWEYIGGYNYLAVEESAAWADGIYYQLIDGNYVLLEGKPANWDENKTSYFTREAKSNALAFDNNILYNFDKQAGWGEVSYDADNHVTSTITIKANTTVYINIFDSIEITSVLNASEGTLIDYSYYRMTSSFTINSLNNIYDKITTLTIAGDAGTDGFAGTEYSVINNTEYAPGLFYATPTGKDYNCEVAITNNTNLTKTYTVGYQVQYTLGNGQMSLQASGGSADSLLSTNWARISNVFGNTNSSVVTVAPYTTVYVTTRYNVSSELTNVIDSRDAWVDLLVTVAESGSSVGESSLSIETEKTETGYTYYLRNNSNKTVDVAATTVDVVHYTYWFSYYNVEQGKPNDWEQRKWQYYYILDGEYVQVGDNMEWNQNIYFYNRVLETDPENKTLSIPAVKLVPNERIEIGTYNKNQTVNGEDYEMDRFVINGVVNGTVANDTVGIVNNGTADAYLVNTSASKAFYVRFKGAATGSEIVLENGYNYYIGIIRPGQMVNLSMSSVSKLTSSHILSVEVLEVDDVYSKEDLSLWLLNDNSSVYSAYEVFFS